MRPALLSLAVSLMCVWGISDARGLPLARKLPMHLSRDNRNHIQPKEGDTFHLSRGNENHIQPKEGDTFHLSRGNENHIQPKEGESLPRCLDVRTLEMTDSSWYTSTYSTDWASGTSSPGVEHNGDSSSSTMEIAGTTTAATSSTSENCRCGVRNTNTRIVGGEEATKHEYPWQAALVTDGGKKPFCGASILSERWILTAAHCEAIAGENEVVIGESDWSTKAETSITKKLKIDKVINHKDYNTITYDNDIALLRLAEPIVFPNDNKIAPVCLPTSGNAYEDVNATVTGWGTLTSGGSQPKTLHEVTVTTMTNKRCGTEQGYYKSEITDNMICAGTDWGGKDSCQGDSGSPLVTDSNYGNSMQQIGIVSWGYGCADYGYPGVYTRVTNYLPWIETITGGSTCQPSS